MPRINTAHFGLIHYTNEDLILFPLGIPAFEQETSFLPLQHPQTGPIMFLQSIQNANLVFTTLPLHHIDPAYVLSPSPEDLLHLQLELPLGDNILCLAILTADANDGWTANLMSPVVIHRQTRRAIQAIQHDSGYSIHHPVTLPR